MSEQRLPRAGKCSIAPGSAIVLRRVWVRGSVCHAIWLIFLVFSFPLAARIILNYNMYSTLYIGLVNRRSRVRIPTGPSRFFFTCSVWFVTRRNTSLLSTLYLIKPRRLLLLAAERLLPSFGFKGLTCNSFQSWTTSK